MDDVDMLGGELRARVAKELAANSPRPWVTFSKLD